jgi:wyosine [tRNA(Phe)-imidazoG37] synthetase (radical SAM superfamily)
MAMPLQQHIVYGPVRSRRLGRSLGINIMPIGLKVCNMNCAYCQYGWTRGQKLSATRRTRWPSPAQVTAAVAARLRRAARDNESLDRLTVAGHGEPTLHPDFEEIAERLVEIRDRLAPDLPLAVLSNSTTAAWPSVRRALALFDQRYMKLDAGDPITYAHVNGLGISIGTIVDALRDLPRVVVQAMFVSDGKSRVDNSTEGAINEWLGAIDAIQPSRVQVYTIDRPPALQGLRAIPMRRLREIAERVRAREIPADVFSSAPDGQRATS